MPDGPTPTIAVEDDPSGVASVQTERSQPAESNAAAAPPARETRDDPVVEVPDVPDDHVDEADEAVRADTTDQSDEVTDREGGPRGDRWRRWAPRVAAGALIMLVTAPLLVTAVQLWRTGYHPAGDLAVIEMRVRDVGRQTPLLGPYSRYGWSHPGPLIYVLLAIPYRLMGAGSSAILSASAVFNAVMVAAMGFVAWRRGRLVLVGLTAALLMIFIYWMTPTYLADPWNPFLTVLPVGLFVMLAWSIVERDRWALPACALVGSFLAQSHVGYLPVVLVVTATVLVEGVGRHLIARRARAHLPEDARPPLVPHRWRRPLLVSLAITVVVWIPVVIDQLTGTGNLRDIAQYFTTSDRTPYGFGRALELMAREWGNRAPWLGGPEPILAAGGAVGPREVDALRLPVAALILGAVLAVAGRAWSALRFQALVVLTALVTVLSVARITDVVYDYLVRWTWIVGVLIWLTALWSIWAGATGTVTRVWAFLQRRATSRGTDRPWALRWAVPRPVRVVGHGLVAAFVLLGILVLGNRAASTDERPVILPEQGSQVVLDALLPQVEAGVPDEGTFWIHAEGGSINTIGDGVALALERRGHPLAFPDDLRYKFGPRRTTEADAPVATVSIIYADDVATWDRRPDVTRIAKWDPLSPEERVEFDTLGRYLRGQFLAVGRDDLIRQLRANDSAAGGFDVPTVDGGALDRWEQLRQRGQVVAVYVGSPPS